MSLEQDNSLSSYAKLGFRSFPTLPTKEPFPNFKWKENSFFNTTKPVNWGEIYGVVIPPEYVVIDIDKKNNKNGIESWKNLCIDLALSDEDRKTMTVQTPSGGFHLYFSKPSNIELSYKLKNYPDIEFLTTNAGKAHYVIGANSLSDLGLYKLLSDFSSIKPLPDALIEVLQKTKKDKNNTQKQTNTDIQDDIDAFTALLIKAPGAIEGQQGDHTTFSIACQGRDFGLSAAKVFELMQTYYNPKCSPQWTPEALSVKISNAFNYASGALGSLSIEQQFDVINNPSNNTTQQDLKWDIGKDKLLKPTLRNCINLTLGHTKIKECIRQNIFANHTEVHGTLPWAKKRLHKTKRWCDDDLLHYRYWLTEQHNVEFTPQVAQDAITYIAILNRYHPIHAYLNSLVWDGIPRVSNWLSVYCGAQDNAYTSKVGTMTLVAAITRVFHPGSSYHHVLVLEGNQGVGKSSVCRILGKSWYLCPTALNPKSPDSVRSLQEGWILELAEMSALKGYDADDVKAFLTRETDVVRFAYGRNPEEFKRHGIFIGTFNPNKYSGYLKDTTGNRRYLPVQCGTKIYMTELARDVDQLWAEAYCMYKKGTPIHIEQSSQLATLAETEINARVMGDTWETVIAEYLAENKISEISIHSVFIDCLTRPISQCTRSDQMRISSILKTLGYERKRNSKGTGYSYFLPEHKKDNFANAALAVNSTDKDFEI